MSCDKAMLLRSAAAAETLLPLVASDCGHSSFIAPECSSMARASSSCQQRSSVSRSLAAPAVVACCATAVSRDEGGCSKFILRTPSLLHSVSSQASNFSTARKRGIVPANHTTRLRHDRRRTLTKSPRHHNPSPSIVAEAQSRRQQSRRHNCQSTISVDSRPGAPAAYPSAQTERPGSLVDARCSSLSGASAASGSSMIAQDASCQPVKPTAAAINHGIRME